MDEVATAQKGIRYLSLYLAPLKLVIGPQQSLLAFYCASRLVSCYLLIMFIADK